MPSPGRATGAASRRLGREPGHDGLGQRPALPRVARQPDPDLVAGERDVARPDARQRARRPAARIAVARGQPVAEPDDELALLARDRRDAGRLGGEAQLGDLDEPQDRRAASARSGRSPPGGTRPGRPASGPAPGAGRARASGPRRARSRRAGGRRPAGRRRAGGVSTTGGPALERRLAAPRPPRPAAASRGRSRPRPCGRDCSRAEDVAGAADLEVRQRDLEAGAQLRRVEDRLQPLAGLVATAARGAGRAGTRRPAGSSARRGRGAGRAGRARACRRGR